MLRATDKEYHSHISVQNLTLNMYHIISRSNIIEHILNKYVPLEIAREIEQSVSLYSNKLL